MTHIEVSHLLPSQADFEPVKHRRLSVPFFGFNCSKLDLNCAQRKIKFTHYRRPMVFKIIFCFLRLREKHLIHLLKKNCRALRIDISICRK